jgi:Ca2+-binding RTX toxin-like protein
VNIQNFSSDNPQTFTGGTLSDNLNGLGGNDTLVGLEGNDTLSGDNDNDSIIGGAGDDFLQGGFNSDPAPDGPSFGDTIIGGEGSDTFFYQLEAEVFDSNGASSTLADLIGEFATGVDKLVFTRSANENGGFNFVSPDSPNASELINLEPSQVYLASPGTNVTSDNIVVADINTGVLVYQRQAGLLQYDLDGFSPNPATIVARFALVDGLGPDLSQSDIIFI